jgi:signal transduction histidine kinase
MFDRFTRLSALPTGGETSNGLGLYIVQKLTESMHGRVWCESRPGEEATFFVTFPSSSPDDMRKV